MPNPRSIAAALALFTLLPMACAEDPTPSTSIAAGAKAASSDPWVRIVEDDDRTVMLQVAMRTYTRADGTGPELLIAGAVHIADRPFYQSLQAALDARDVVLFEGVKPSAAGPDDATISDEERIERTTGRVRLLGILVERYRLEHDGALPGCFSDCAEAMGDDARHLRWLTGASTDAWGNTIGYTPTTTAKGFDVISLGADNAPGGTGKNADIMLSHDKPISPSELGLTPGLQAQLARTFHLRFQLDEMDEAKENWRNADLSIEQINERLKARGASGDFLFSMLDGSSAIGALASGMLNAIQAIPGAAPRGKLMIMDLLSMSDEDALGASMPGGAELIDVIIGERNQEVVNELGALVEQDPALKTVGIVYGAGHMPDLERRLADQLGYHQVGDTTWNTAMRLPLAKLGITPEERMMVRYSVLQQIAAAKKAQKVTPAK